MQKWLFAVKMKKMVKKIEDMPLFNSNMSRKDLVDLCAEHRSEIESLFKSRVADFTHFKKNTQLYFEILNNSKKQTEEWEAMDE